MRSWRDILWRGGRVGVDKTLIHVQTDPDVARFRIGACKRLRNDEKKERGSNKVDELHDGG
jgi:hypothetical protein